MWDVDNRQGNYKPGYCPGGAKRRNSQVDLSGQKTYFPIVVACLDGLGRLVGIGKIIRIHVRRVFSSHIDEKSGKPPKSFFDFLTFVIRHRFFFFVPETLNLIFLENQKRRAPENDRDPSN